MEFVVILVVVVAVGALIYFNRSARSLDINQDGRVDAADAEMAIKNAAEGVKTTVKRPPCVLKLPQDLLPKNQPQKNPVPSVPPLKNSTVTKTCPCSDRSCEVCIRCTFQLNM